jgi:hypothetical protein
LKSRLDVSIHPNGIDDVGRQLIGMNAAAIGFGDARAARLQSRPELNRNVRLGPYRTPSRHSRF